MKKFILLFFLLILNVGLLYEWIALKHQLIYFNLELQKLPIWQQKWVKLKNSRHNAQFPWSPYKNFDASLQAIESFLSTERLFKKELEFSAPKPSKRRLGVECYPVYISGFLLHSDCIAFLKAFVQFDWPLWVQSLTIQRNYSDNYGLQFAMTGKLAAFNEKDSFDEVR